MRRGLGGLVVLAIVGGAWMAAGSASPRVPATPAPGGEQRPASLDAAAIAFFPGDCPVGWTAYAGAEGRAIVGLTDGGTLEGTVGTPLGDGGTIALTQAPTHAHPVDPPPGTVTTESDNLVFEFLHTHNDTAGSGEVLQTADDSVGNDLGTVDSDPHVHDHQVTFDFTLAATGDASVDVTTPYVQLRACRTNDNNPIEVPSGAVAFWTQASCPAGWSTLTEARGRVLVGLRDGGALASQIGTALDDLGSRVLDEPPEHDHAIASVDEFTDSDNPSLDVPTNSNHDADGGSGGAAQETDATIAPASSTAGVTHTHAAPDIAPFASDPGGQADVDVTMPYVQLLACEKD